MSGGESSGNDDDHPVFDLLRAQRAIYQSTGTWVKMTFRSHEEADTRDMVKYFGKHGEFIIQPTFVKRACPPGMIVNTVSEYQLSSSLVAKMNWLEDRIEFFPESVEVDGKVIKVTRHLRHGVLCHHCAFEFGHFGPACIQWPQPHVIQNESDLNRLVKYHQLIQVMVKNEAVAAAASDDKANAKDQQTDVATKAQKAADAAKEKAESLHKELNNPKVCPVVLTSPFIYQKTPLNSEAHLNCDVGLDLYNQMEYDLHRMVQKRDTRMWTEWAEREKHDGAVGELRRMQKGSQDNQKLKTQPHDTLAYAKSMEQKMYAVCNDERSRLGYGLPEGAIELSRDIHTQILDELDKQAAVMTNIKAAGIPSGAAGVAVLGMDASFDDAIEQGIEKGFQQAMHDIQKAGFLPEFQQVPFTGKGERSKKEPDVKTLMEIMKQMLVDGPDGGGAGGKEKSPSKGEISKKKSPSKGERSKKSGQKEAGNSANGGHSNNGSTSSSNSPNKPMKTSKKHNGPNRGRQ